MIMNKIEIGGYFHLELSRKRKKFIHDDGGSAEFWEECFRICFVLKKNREVMDSILYM